MWLGARSNGDTRASGLAQQASPYKVRKPARVGGAVQLPLPGSFTIPMIGGKV
jgi:hypothetical protein